MARIVKVLCSPHCKTPTFQQHLIRCIAASMDTPELVQVVDDAGGLDRLCAMLWEIVSAGGWRPRALVLGNLVKCLIAATRHGESRG